ncbi:hypothetical protein RISK_005966 [Rhodopirellula islandica]|uniref:Uncharacterized protein n=1 Tax=Rhodopirellula islandica TaxID=595434 RepID=A0A0J1B6C0_RHOIS|nr:hypothetical protein RISK_005966 [Rhodopirellula islandica]
MRGSQREKHRPNMVREIAWPVRIDIFNRRSLNSRQDGPTRANLRDLTAGTATAG